MRMTVWAVMVLLLVSNANAEPTSAADAVVLIKAKDSAGSGFYVSANGLLVTNYHVIEDARLSNFPIVIHDDAGGTSLASIVDIDEALDIALLQVHLTRAPKVLSLQAGRPSKGSPIWAIGYPSTGPKKLIRATVDEYKHLPGEWGDWLTSDDLATSPGNSGGPVVTAAGKVVGVVTLGKRGELVGCRLVSDFAKMVKSYASAPPITSLKAEVRRGSISKAGSAVESMRACLVCRACDGDRTVTTRGTSSGGGLWATRKYSYGSKRCTRCNGTGVGNKAGLLRASQRFVHQVAGSGKTTPRENEHVRSKLRTAAPLGFGNAVSTTINSHWVSGSRSVGSGVMLRAKVVTKDGDMWGVTAMNDRGTELIVLLMPEPNMLSTDDQIEHGDEVLCGGVFAGEHYGIGVLKHGFIIE